MWKYLFILTFIPPAAFAARDQTEHWTINFYIGNDLFSEADQDYTSGIRTSWVSPDLADYLEGHTLPQWVRSINKRLTFFHQTKEGLKRNAVASIGQTIYTPRI
ncbi:MAG: DUF2219 family protein [Pseudomonadales bacterium]|nr:DUF2219 family protein [Pseudomonadales bacterium]